MIRMDEESVTPSDSKRDAPSKMVRDYSISSKDRPTTKTVSLGAECEQAQDIDTGSQTVSGWGTTAATSGTFF